MLLASLRKLTVPLCAACEEMQSPLLLHALIIESLPALTMVAIPMGEVVCMYKYIDVDGEVVI
jgi:hypothetical protein